MDKPTPIDPVARYGVLLARWNYSQENALRNLAAELREEAAKVCIRRLAMLEQRRGIGGEYWDGAQAMAVGCAEDICDLNLNAARQVPEPAMAGEERIRVTPVAAAPTPRTIDPVSRHEGEAMREEKEILDRARQLKDTPTLTAAESRQVVRTVAKTTLTPSRREALERYARMAREAYSKPIKFI